MGNIKKANTKAQDLAELEQAFDVIVSFLENNSTANDNVANFDGTPRRAAKALMEMCRKDTEIAKDIAEILKKSFPIDRKSNLQAGMVTQGPIVVNSMCPHHLLPVRYHAFVSYLPKPDGEVLGLSKLARIATVLGRRPVLQEKLAADICDVLHLPESTDKGSHHPQFKQIRSVGSACLLIGVHNCMSCRGIVSGAKTATAELRGEYIGTNLESKFYQAIEHLKTTFPYEG